jgi:hypothetical protein
VTTGNTGRGEASSSFDYGERSTTTSSRAENDAPRCDGDATTAATEAEGAPKTVEEEEGPTTRDDADTAANDESANDKKSEDAAVTRKGRETQIAAMIASFDAAPAYQLYKTDEVQEADEVEE